jgi:hypothetical protein
MEKSEMSAQHENSSTTIDERWGVHPSMPLGATKSEIIQFLETLPRNLHWAQEQEGNAPNTMLMETLEEDEEGEEEETDKNEEGLKVAWQYRKSVQQERLGHDTSKPSSRSSASDIYCHSYDLSGRLSDQLKSREDHQTLEDVSHLNNIQCCENATACSSGRTCGFRLYQRLLEELESLLAQLIAISSIR